MKKTKLLTILLLLVFSMLMIVSCGEKTFVVSFDSCGGTATASVTLNAGESVSKPEDPTREGHDFLGWYCGDVLYDFSSAVTSDLTLSAKWAPTIKPETLTGNWKGTGTFGEDEYRYYLSFLAGGAPSLRIIHNGTELHLIGVKASSERGMLKISFAHGGTQELLLSVSSTLSGTGMKGEAIVLKQYEDVTVTYHFANGKTESVVVDKGTAIPLPALSVTGDVLLDAWYDMLGTPYTGTELATADIDIYEALYTNGLKIENGRVIAYEGDAADVIVPRFYKGISVTEIGDSAFEDCDIKSIKLPLSIKAIGARAFCNCSSLDSVKLDGVETIGEKAFYNCTSFHSITIPSSVKSIGFAALASDMMISEYEESIMYAPIESKLEDVFLDSIIGNSDSSAFFAYMFGAPSAEYMNYYEGGTTVTVNGEEKVVDIIYCLPMSLKQIYLTGCESVPEKAFYNCFYIELISFLSSVKTIGNSAFECCYYANIERLESLETVGDRAFYATAFDGEKMPHLSYIGDLAFANTLIYEMAFSSKLTHIGTSAFAYTGLREIILPKDLQYLGSTAFFGCNYLEDVYFLSAEPCEIGSTPFTEVDEEGTVYYSAAMVWVPNASSAIAYRNHVNMRDYAASLFSIDYQGKTGYITEGDCLIGYINKDDERLVTLTVPEGIKEIADYAFYNRRDIEDIVMPEGFTKIGKYAFYNCTSVQNLILPSTIKEIDDYAFTGFFVGNNISRLYFPEGFERIGEGAFMSSFNLKIVELPSTLKYIGYLAFGMSNSLERISFSSTTPPEVGSYQNNQEVLTEIFSIINAGKTIIYVPHGRIDGTPIYEIYKSTAGFSNYASYIKAKPEGEEVGHYGNGKFFIDLDGCDTVTLSTLVESDVDTSGDGGTRYELQTQMGQYVLLGAVLQMTFPDGEEVRAIYSNRTIIMSYHGESLNLTEPRYYYDSYNWTNFKLYGNGNEGYGLFDMYGSFLTPFEWKIDGAEFMIKIDGNNKLPEHSEYAGVVEYKGSYDAAGDSFKVSFMLNDYEQIMDFNCERNDVIYAAGESIRFYGTYKCFAPQNPEFAMFTFVSYGNGKVDVYIGEQVYKNCTYTMENGIITIDFQTNILTFEMDANGFLDGDFFGTACHFVYVDELMDSTKLPSRDDAPE